MIHHGTQLFICIYLCVYNRKKVNMMYFVRSILVFVAFCGVAITLNEVMHAVKPDVTFNMFYFSPYYANHLPILSTIDALVPDFVFIIIYILGFTGISLGIQYAMVGINKLVQKLSKKNA